MDSAGALQTLRGDGCGCDGHILAHVRGRWTLYGGKGVVNQSFNPFVLSTRSKNTVRASSGRREQTVSRSILCHMTSDNMWKDQAKWEDTAGDN